jgi:hypothetical protein
MGARTYQLEDEIQRAKFWPLAAGETRDVARIQRLELELSSARATCAHLANPERPRCCLWCSTFLK